MKTGLVLEGGGLRGAYTAGALSWLLKEGIDFDYNVGISSGAQHLTSYLTKDAKYLKDIAVTIGAQEFKKGLVPLLKEGNFVGYDHLFNYALKQLAPLDLNIIKKSKVESEFGIFDLKAGKTVWVNTKDIDEDYNILKAASIIPLAGRPVVIDGRKYVDAGAAYMIPIERSIEKNVDKHLVITTKPKSYVRKPTGFISNLYLAIVYRPYKVFRDLIKGRSELYYKQRGIINELVTAGKALEIFPSQAFNIGRFGGDLNELEQLFETGFNDCESRRDEIYEFLNLKVDDN